jgi:hypothetical protein
MERSVVRDCHEASVPPRISLRSIRATLADERKTKSTQIPSTQKVESDHSRSNCGPKHDCIRNVVSCRIRRSPMLAAQSRTPRVSRATWGHSTRHVTQRVGRCICERRLGIRSTEANTATQKGLRRAATWRVSPMRRSIHVVVIRINVAACLFGIAAILKVLL